MFLVGVRHLRHQRLPVFAVFFISTGHLYHSRLLLCACFFFVSVFTVSLSHSVLVFSCSSRCVLRCALALRSLVSSMFLPQCVRVCIALPGWSAACFSRCVRCALRCLASSMVLSVCPRVGLDYVLVSSSFSRGDETSMDLVRRSFCPGVPPTLCFVFFFPLFGSLCLPLQVVSQPFFSLRAGKHRAPGRTTQQKLF